MRKLLFTTALLPSLFTPTLHASEEDDLLALMTLLEEETELATRNKINADYVPGMLSILHQDELIAHGYRTVADALNQVPGFYLNKNNKGEDVPIVRGVGASLSTNSLKILINDVPVNRAIDGSTDWVFLLPLTMIDRIEVIRGPGSAVYGEFAFSGVVNVILKHDNSVALQTASHNHRQFSASTDQHLSASSTVGLNLTSWERDKSNRPGAMDSFSTSGVGYSPSTIHDQEKGLAFFSHATISGLNIHTAYSNIERGGWYGSAASIPSGLAPRKEESYLADVTYLWQLGQALSVNADLNVFQSKLTHAEFLPIPLGAGQPGPPPPEGEPRPVVETELFVQNSNKDRVVRASIDASWIANTQHTLFSEFSYSYSEVLDSWRRNTIEGEQIKASSDRNLVVDGVNRTLASLSLQDQWQLSKKIELTSGLRFDHYDDWGSNVSPRLAAVWRANDNHILKYQFSQAFRPPTLADQHPGENVVRNFQYFPLQEEKITSNELAYIIRKPNSSFRATVFHNQIEDLIEYYLNPGDPPRWRNRADITTSGIEIEWEQQVLRNLEYYSNLSYVNAKDALDETDEKLIGSVPWLANIGITWKPTLNNEHTLQWRYVGRQEDWEILRRVPTQNEFNSWQTLDYTLTQTRLFDINSLELQLGVNNIFDQQYYVASNPPQFLYGLPQGERCYWLRMAYVFSDEH